MLGKTIAASVRDSKYILKTYPGAVEHRMLLGAILSTLSGIQGIDVHGYIASPHLVETDASLDEMEETWCLPWHRPIATHAVR